MRVFLNEGFEFERGGARHVAAAGAFYELPAELAEPLLAAGKALPASTANEIIEPPATEPADQPTSISVAPRAPASPEE